MNFIEFYLLLLTVFIVVWKFATQDEEDWKRYETHNIPCPRTKFLDLDDWR